MHNKNNDAWIIFRNNVYDITDFISKHPGGNIIKKALGKDIEKVWDENNVGWHLNNSKVIKILDKYKIGSIREQFINQTAKNNLYPKLHMEGFNNKKEIKNNNTFIFDILKFTFDLVAE
jgi:sulfite oxidase